MTKLLTGFVVVWMCSSTGYAGTREVITVRVAAFAPNYFKDDAGNWKSEIHRSVLDALEPYDTRDDVTLVVVRRLE